MTFADGLRHQRKCILESACGPGRWPVPSPHEQGECMNGVASLRGAGLLLMAATAWGGLFPVAMVTLPVLDPFHMTAIRYGITAIIFVGLLALAEGPRALKMEGRGLRAALLGTAGFAGLG